MSIEVKNLTHWYDPDAPYSKKAVDDVSFTIEKGEFIGLIGHTGSGKSTLIQHLNGLIRPTSGKVLYNGTDIFSKDVDLKQIRQKVGLVFQYPEHQLFEMTVRKDVEFGPRNLHLSKEEIDRRVDRALEVVGLPPETWDRIHMNALMQNLQIKCMRDLVCTVVAGVGLDTMVYTIFIYLFTAVTAGGSVVVSQYIGSRDN